MKLISWNVNGLRAIVKKNFYDFFKEADADFFCLQETKLQAGQIEMYLPGYEQYWHYAEKKGYSGTAIFTKKPADNVIYGLVSDSTIDNEGRVITLEYESFYLVNCYTPNTQTELARLTFRLEWEAAFRKHITILQSTKPVILCGDLNVAHKEIDLKNWQANQKNAGFTQEERQAFSQLLDLGLFDAYRQLYPDKSEQYTWWSYRFKARERNAGWRIDYFCLSAKLLPFLEDVKLHQEILGSDHCPVELSISLQ